MCRLFGSRAASPSGAAHELLHAANALRVQSREHPDGWGLGWYEDGVPRVVRSLSPAHGDREFETVSSFLTSTTVVAHVRRASVGRVAEENTHPFRRGRWLFAHNGTLPAWAEVRPFLEDRLEPGLRASLDGETDSERCFLLFLTELQRRCDLDQATASAASEALAAATTAVWDLCTARTTEAPSTTFLATDGRVLVACRRGRTLHLSTNPAGPDGTRSHVAVASEELHAEVEGTRGWHPLDEGALVSVDAALRLELGWLPRR